MSRLCATFVTLFPDSLHSIINSSILGRAIQSGILEVKTEFIRDHAKDKHKTVDDTPYGGGPGQLMRVDRVVDAVRAVHSNCPLASRRTILLDPAGPLFTQATAQRLSSYEHLVFVCGRYEGIDARVHHYIDEAISIGDYVLTGGEIPALVVLDAVTRLLPGVLGNEASAVSESMSEALLEYSQYTRPVDFEGHLVPEVFAGGHHAKIAEERRKEQLYRTQLIRPDLIGRQVLSSQEKKWLEEKSAENPSYPWKK